MPYFEWDPLLETGYGLIDDQHRSLFALANALAQAVARDGADDQVIADAIYRLTDYVVEHFAAEEELMQESSYPEVGLHRTLHAHLTAETLGMAARYFNGEDVRPEEIARFVSDWLRGHIEAADKRAVAHIREHRSEKG